MHTCAQYSLDQRATVCVGLASAFSLPHRSAARITQRSNAAARAPHASSGAVMGLSPLVVAAFAIPVGLGAMVILGAWLGPQFGLIIVQRDDGDDGGTSAELQALQSAVPAGTQTIYDDDNNPFAPRMRPLADFETVADATPATEFILSPSGEAAADADGWGDAGLAMLGMSQQGSGEAHAGAVLPNKRPARRLNNKDA